ncbi:uncharacterized protein LOC129758601 [Uranotaenia lowii]|uniref:uncharacterized protein LOC129749773 n=1 Tax=Uranotaenia lowii TaxID=190385 RepID=UPI002479EFE1|nr:uncharacterized protein LOC129749773 [Uranotaenia lowii]XP_055608387.1 uncharacterized protein LOC129755770 [Uranotaenia lowii]XP_055612103.1 uncharacterized protein LOC129758586 [Uranotaenia lowii]XP_055612121.1 uncharacterized protein LOC129758601 [Uranotaenia lowii]
MEKGYRLDDAGLGTTDTPTTFNRARTHSPVHRYQPQLMEVQKELCFTPSGSSWNGPECMENITSESKVIRQTRLLHPHPVKDSRLVIIVLAIPQEAIHPSHPGSARGGTLLLLKLKGYQMGHSL